MKTKVINYLKQKLHDLEITTDKYKLSNLDVRIRDLESIITLIKQYEFIEKDSLEIDDIVLINPEGDGILGKVFYTNTLLNYSVDVIAGKIVSEILCYKAGICTYTEKKALSLIYLHLAHLTLIDVSFKYYAQSKRGRISEIVQAEDPAIFAKYQLNFPKEKLNYYSDFAMKNYKTHTTFIIVKAEHKFTNGVVLEYDRCLLHLTAYEGMNLSSKTTFSQSNIYFNIINMDYKGYLRLIERYKDLEERSYGRAKVDAFDFNYNKIRSFKEKNELLEQWHILQALF